MRRSYSTRYRPHQNRQIGACDACLECMWNGNIEDCLDSCKQCLDSALAQGGTGQPTTARTDSTMGLEGSTTSHSSSDPYPPSSRSHMSSLHLLTAFLSSASSAKVAVKTSTQNPSGPMSSISSSSIVSSTSSTALNSPSQMSSPLPPTAISTLLSSMVEANVAVKASTQSASGPISSISFGSTASPAASATLNTPGSAPSTTGIPNPPSMLSSGTTLSSLPQETPSSPEPSSGSSTAAATASKFGTKLTLEISLGCGMGVLVIFLMMLYVYRRKREQAEYASKMTGTPQPLTKQSAISDLHSISQKIDDADVEDESEIGFAHRGASPGIVDLPVDGDPKSEQDYPQRKSSAGNAPMQAENSDGPAFLQERYIIPANEAELNRIATKKSTRTLKTRPSTRTVASARPVSSIPGGWGADSDEHFGGYGSDMWSDSDVLSGGH